MIMHLPPVLLASLAGLGVLLSVGCTSRTSEQPEAPAADAVADEPAPTAAEPPVVDDPSVQRVTSLSQERQFGWRAAPDPEMGEDDPGTVLVQRANGHEPWTEVRRLPSRPVGVDVAHDGRLAIALSTAELLDGVLLDGTLVSLGLPDAPAAAGTLPIRWLDAAPNGAAVVLVSGRKMEGGNEQVALVQTETGWEVDPHLGTCRALVVDGETASYADGGGEGRAVDLNGDGQLEALIREENSCGTGGCNTPVYAACGPATGGYFVVAPIGAWGSVTVLDTMTNGWHDLSEEQRGEPGMTEVPRVRWAFNGTEYAPVRD